MLQLYNNKHKMLLQLSNLQNISLIQDSHEISIEKRCFKNHVGFLFMSVDINTTISYYKVDIIVYKVYTIAYFLKP